MSVDECYSEKKNRKEFSAYKICVDDARFTCEYVKDIIANFNGDAEKCYPLFYKQSLKKRYSNIYIKASEIPPSDDNMLTQAKGRGGLWTVTTEVFQIFQYICGILLSLVNNSYKQNN